VVGEGEIKRYFAIGDIHGCLSPLERLMEEIRPLVVPEEDALVFIGDYIDRGPESRQVVELILRIKEEFPNVICLKGNHEDMFLTWVLTGRDYELYLYNGGGTTIRSYLSQGKFSLPEEHLRFFQSLPLYYETEDYIFVHAGLRPGVPLEQQDPFDLFWIREEFIYSNYDFGKTVIFGHTPFRKPFVTDRKIGIDTGAVYGGALTCVELPARKFYSVAASSDAPLFGVI